MVTLPPELRDAPELPLLLKAGAFQLEHEALARSEFRDWLKPETKAEFINGEKIVHSPARYIHTRVLWFLAKILDAHVTAHDLGIVMVEKVLVGLSRNDYEPDIVFYRKERCAKFDDELMVYPAPDLVVEILSKTTEVRDTGVKYRDYAAHEIPEYWIVDPSAKTLQRYTNERGSYILQPLNLDQLIRSPLFPDLEIPLNAIFDSAANKQFVDKIR
jgi:Uma2 family endonuclease